MTTVIVKHKVRDYDAWFPIFREHGKERAKYGCLDERVHRGEADPNEIAIVMRWPTSEAFRRFQEGSGLAEAMKRAGVLEAPTILLLSEPVFEQSHMAALKSR